MFAGILLLCVMDFEQNGKRSPSRTAISGICLALSNRRFLYRVEYKLKIKKKKELKAYCFTVFTDFQSVFETGFPRSFCI